VKQILQSLKTGVVALIDAPAPTCRAGQVLIATSHSLISAGTERMLVEFGQANLLAKARSQPDKVRQVLAKVKTDGLLPTVDAVLSKLDEPMALGYCNVGVVTAVGPGVANFAVGDRVVSNGKHAEIVSVPQNLCACVPIEVTDEGAAFVVLAAIGLQGIRLAQPTLGEKVVVTGLGLIGLLTVQMLVANGCQVLGLDFNQERLALAAQFGAQTVNLADGADPVAAGLAFSQGRGVDAVLITAATSSSDPVRQAALMSRKRGRIILVGVAGLELSRADFYEKELTFQVSCSYGPGRYDPNYEEKGQDYPFGFVRWTEQRNFEAVLDLMGGGRLNVAPLISHHVPLNEAERAYQLLTDDPAALGILLAYPDGPPDLRRAVTTRPANEPARATAGTAPVCGVLGAGNFASRILLPALAKTEAKLHTIASGSGVTAAVAARKFKFDQAASDSAAVLQDDAVNAIFILTRHNSHSGLTAEALQAGKHVFVEKPLALNRDELAQVEEAVMNRPDLQLLVGFNRRFAPLIQQMQKLLRGRVEPVTLLYTINAGMISPDHWTQDPAVGGGRIIGEACHFIDLLRFLVGQPIVGVQARMMGGNRPLRHDKMNILLDFADGSVGAVHYLANGSKQFPKERIELFSEGRILLLDNFHSLKGYDWPGFSHKKLWRQDKGHQAEVNAFIERVVQGGNWLIPWAELKEVALATFVAVEQAQEPPRGLA
jgi:predicted dehydrogenase/threonine dehydrogenase-like Zn-dependent dehydrogenase